MRRKFSYNVAVWDFNTGELREYDVIPYLIDRYDGLKKKERPVTFDGFREFVRREGMYQWWSRCEYEMLLLGWPPKDDDIRNAKKVDVWQQVKMNLDVVTRTLMMSLGVDG